MWNAFSSVSPLLGGIFLILLGTGGLSTFTTLRLTDGDFPYFVIGLVSTMYMLGLFLGALYTQRLIGTVGHVRAFAAFGSIISAATLAHAFLFDPWFWGVLRFVVGVCAVGMYMCTESWLNEKTDSSIRGEVFSLYQMTVYLAFGIGQFLINLPDNSGFLILSVMSILMSLAIVPILSVRIKPPKIRKPEPLNFVELWRTSPSGMSVCFVSGIIVGSIMALGPMYAHLMGLNTHQISTFMSALIFGALVFQWPIGKFSDYFDRRKVILFITIAATLVSAMLCLGGQFNNVSLYILISLFGGCSYTLYPLAVAYTNDYLAPNQMVPGAAGLLMANGLGTTAGPIASSIFVEIIGANGLFLFCGIIALATSAIVVLRMQQRTTPDISKQTVFESAPRTTPVVYELRTGVDQD